MSYSLSKVDHQRFGVVTAKWAVQAGDKVAELFAQARNDQVELLIVRVPTSDLRIVQQLEKEGAFLTDTLVYYLKAKMELYQDSLPAGYSTRLATETDANSLETIAHATFSGYLGHYHSDPYLKKEDCDLVYSSWAASSCIVKDVADAVLLVEKDNEIAAFATIKVNQAEIEGVLFGVAPTHRGKGLYLSLMKLSQNWGVVNNCIQMVTSTQVTNTAVQKNWCRLGFNPDKSYYTFHKWFK